MEAFAFDDIANIPYYVCMHTAVLCVCQFAGDLRSDEWIYQIMLRIFNFPDAVFYYRNICSIPVWI